MTDAFAAQARLGRLDMAVAAYGRALELEPEIDRVRRARFTADEAALPWQRFETLDARLQADCDQFEPMMHVTSTRYRFYDMPEDFEVDDFIASWG